MNRPVAPISPPVVLSIAGSDSGGGAGIQADLKTVEAGGAFGTSAITSVTAQNTRGVRSVHTLPVENVEAQITAVSEDFDVAAVKTGMLATAELLDLVSSHATTLPNLVVDPVMVATSGDRLLDETAEGAYDSLLAEATLVTPNADEASVLTDVTVEDADSAAAAGRALVTDQGADAALVTGGHLVGDHVLDTLVTANGANDADVGVRTYHHDRVDTDATHGAGCTLSSAIATRLAHGDDLQTAVGRGLDLLSRAVRYSVDVGRGPGPVHHLVELRNDGSRAATADLVDVLAERCRGTVPDSLAPAAGVGVAGATPHAEEPDDVAALDRTGGGTVGFGTGDALAAVLLAARERTPAMRFGVELLASETTPAAPGLTTVTVRTDEETSADGSRDRSGAMPVLASPVATITDAPSPPDAVLVRPDASARNAPASSADGRDTLVVLGRTTNEVVDRLAAVVGSAG